MKADEIRKLCEAQPFKPFNLIMVNGKKLPVEKRYYLGMTDDGQALVHSALDGGFDTFGPEHVKAIDFISPRRAGTRRKDGRRRRNGAA